MNASLRKEDSELSVFALIAKPRSFALLLCAYWLIHFGLRLVLSDTFQIDGAEQVYLSQWLRWDYGNLQPPALTWFFWALWQVIDPSLWSFVLVRYVILGIASWLWYQITCCLFSDLGWRFLAASSWVLVGELGWKLHQGSTHTTVLILALLMTFHAMCLISESGRRSHYAYLGLGLCVGIMAKYTFAGFLLPALFAALSLSALRARVVHPNILFSLLPAIIAGTVVLFSMSSWLSFGDGLERKAVIALGGLVSGDFAGAGRMIAAVVGFFAPFLVIVIAAIGSQSRGLRTSLMQQFLTRFFTLVFLTLFAFVLLCEVSEMKVRWMHPLLLLGPFWVMGWMAGRLYRLPAQSIIAGIIGISVLTVFVGQYYKLHGSTAFGVGSRPSWPVSAAISGLPKVWRATPSIVCVSDAFIGAQLRVVAPEMKYISGRDSRCQWFVSGAMHRADVVTSVPSDSKSNTAIRNQTAFTIWLEAIP